MTPKQILFLIRTRIHDRLWWMDRATHPDADRAATRKALNDVLGLLDELEGRTRREYASPDPDGVNVLSKPS